MMAKHSSNKYLTIANLSTFIYLGLGHFVALPNIVEGFCVGIAISFYLICLYDFNHDISKLKCFKKNVIGRFAK